MTVYDFFALLGGVALFLFGMDMMSKGLERAAGNKMRSILEKLTTNRFLGTIVGIAITAIIQSSSAVTATVVSFVNSGLMNLAQAAGVIFGANIGTSVTGQLMAFNFDDFAPIIVALSVFVFMFINHDMTKKIAYIFIGFGVLFIGMGMMKDSMAVLADSPAVMDAIQNAASPIILVLIGLVITALIQSNSAMVGILIGMAASGLVSLDMCFYVIIGSDIGACITAFIASINGNRNAKRAALIHILFNVIGSTVIFILLSLFTEPITNFILMLSPGEGVEQTMRAVAMANTCFRVFSVIIIFPFAKYLVKLTQIIIPIKDHSGETEDYSKLKYVGDHTAITPGTALVETAKEIERVGNLAVGNLEMAYDMLKTKDKKSKTVIDRNEGYINQLTREIQTFMVHVTQMDIPNTDEGQVAGYFHVIIDIERIGDHAQNLAEFAERCADDKIEFTETAWKELDEMYHLVLKNVKESIRIFRNNDFGALPAFASVEDTIDDMEGFCQNQHIKRMSQGVCSPKSGIYSDILSNLERIGDHANNIAFAIVPDGKFLNLATGELVRKA